jgi:hypothetical protein
VCFVRERNAIVPLQRLKRAIGFAASLIAVWCQIVLLATIAQAPLGLGADPIGNAPICHTDDGTPPAPPNPGHPGHDCALCVLCVSHGLPVALLSTAPSLLERRPVATVRLYAAQPRGPPVRLVAAAQPRGPPSLI